MIELLIDETNAVLRYETLDSPAQAFQELLAYLTVQSLSGVKITTVEQENSILYHCRFNTPLTDTFSLERVIS